MAQWCGRVRMLATSSFHSAFDRRCRRHALADATFDALGATAVPGGAIDEVNASRSNSRRSPATATGRCESRHRQPQHVAAAAGDRDERRRLRNAHARREGRAQRGCREPPPTTRPHPARRRTRKHSSGSAQSPMEIIQMPDAELDALGSLVEPVYADLRQDPVIAADSTRSRTSRLGRRHTRHVHLRNTSAMSSHGRAGASPLD